MAWTRVPEKKMKDALVKGVQFKDAIEQIAIETGNHRELQRMNQLEKEVEEIINSLSKIARVRQEHLAKESK